MFKKKKQCQVWDTSPQVSGQMCLGDLQIMQAIGIALGFPSETDDKTLLMKTPHTLVTECEEIKLAQKVINSLT